MRKMVIAAAVLLGVMLCIGQTGELTRWQEVVRGHSVLTVHEIFQVASALAQGTGKVPTYSEVDAIIGKYHCTVCHGGNEPRGGLNLESYARLMKGGGSGPAVVPGTPEKSELIRRLKGLSEPRMPYTGPPWLTDEEVATIEAWITAGAKEVQ